MQKKYLVGLAALALIVGVAVASIVIWSNVVHVSNAAYVLNLSETHAAGIVKLTGYLTNQGFAVPSGTVTFYSCASDGSSPVAIGTATTNSTGYATYSYTMLTGDYYFIASYTT